MSHIVTVQTRLLDDAALSAACCRLKIPDPTVGPAKLYGGEATGLIVNLPGWTYPIVIDISTGAVQYDNFEGHWGDQAELDRLLQAYAVEKTKLEARKKGYTVSEVPLSDGSIKLQILEGT